ncbi:MAG: hypothetical protein M3466_10100 [Gemmatimonadota bacterium]|nr:hypothetical protein [Gemmatimonadota bacterium]
MRRTILCAAFSLLAWTSTAEARLVSLRIERREIILDGRSFGKSGAYEKLVGKAEFAVDPSLPGNAMIVDLRLAPRNSNGEVEFTAEFFLLKPVDPRKGNGRLLYEVGNRGGKNMLIAFQKASASTDPTTEAEFGDGGLMREGYTLLWMGWQWDVPDGRMRMEIPIATEMGGAITGVVRGNFIVNQNVPTASLSDRRHKAYAVIDPESPEHFMTVRNERIDPPLLIPRARWRFVDSQTVALDGGFEPGRIYDVVYRSINPRVAGLGLAGTRDIVSFFKYERGDANPIPTIRYAIARKRGAVIIGHETAANIARAYAVTDTSLITVRGGEDYQFGAFSLRIVPNIHSPLFGKRYYNDPLAGSAPRGLKAPLTRQHFVEGGNLAYLLRMAGHRVLIMGSMNYIEREMNGLRPDIALIGANQSRKENYDYAGRLMRALGHPAIVFPTHISPEDAEVKVFAREVNVASPRTRVMIPTKFEPIVVPAIH